MKQAVRTTVILAALISLGSAGWKAPAPADASAPVSLTLSSVVMNFDDGLDVRDELGRPVKSEVARQEFKQLFVSTVFGILTRPELPQMAAFLAALEKTWNLLMGTLAQPIAQAWRSLIDLGMPTTRKSQAPPSLALAAAVISMMLLVRFGILDNASGKKSLLSCLSTVIIRC